MIITIDGPSVSGKSTVARAVAQELHFFYIASGYIYRGLAYALMNAREYTQDSIAQADNKDILYCLDPSRFAYHYDAVSSERIIFEGRDITALIKIPTMDAASSLIGTNGLARSAVLAFIRSIALNHDIVIDGRDCGTVMFPLADFKFYLSASLPVRAHRWQAMQAREGKHVSLEQAQMILAERDERDSTRIIAPLKIPAGALMIDSSDFDASQVVEIIVQKVREKQKK